jgi:sulfur carrier protein ThiS
VKVNIKILSGGVKEEILEVTSGTKYEDILSSLHINPEIVIVFSNGNPVPLDETVAAGDIKILRVVTGG